MAALRLRCQRWDCFEQVLEKLQDVQATQQEHGELLQRLLEREPKISVRKAVELTGVSRYIITRLRIQGLIQSYQYGKAVRVSLAEILHAMKTNHCRVE